MDEERNGSRETDLNEWAMPARRPSGAQSAPTPPPPGPPGQPGPWHQPGPAPTQHGHYGGPPPYGPPPSYGPPGYPGGYAAPYGGGGWAPTPRINGLAIASMVCGIVWIYWIGSILALVFGYIAKNQIDKSNGGETGRGMAIAGIVLGWVGVGILTLVIVFAAIGAATSDPSSSSY